MLNLFHYNGGNGSGKLMRPRERQNTKKGDAFWKDIVKGKRKQEINVTNISHRGPHAVNWGRGSTNGAGKDPSKEGEIENFSWVVLRLINTHISGR